MKQCYIGLEFHTCRSIYKSCDDKSQPIRKPCNIYSESNLAEYVTQSHSRFVEKEQELLSELLTYIRYASKNDFGCYVATGLSEFEPGTFFRHFIETGAEHFEEIHGENPLAMNMECVPPAIDMNRCMTSDTTMLKSSFLELVEQGVRTAETEFLGMCLFIKKHESWEEESGAILSKTREVYNHVKNNPSIYSPEIKENLRRLGILAKNGSQNKLNIISMNE